MRWTLFILLLVSTYSLAQRTTVTGKIIEEETGSPIPFAQVFFKNSKIGTESDFDGNYKLESYYATDTISVRASGFEPQSMVIKKDQAQVVDFKLSPVLQTTEEVVIKAPDEKPSTILFRRVVKNKSINNKEKLDAYQYETYNKIQFDLNNIGDNFDRNKIVQGLKVIMDYMDTLEGKKLLPLILSESITDFYYRTSPVKKKEVLKASRITGVDNLELDQYLGDMYQDINVYDNYINIFDRSFISPIASFALNYYKFFLQDSMFVDNQWCYLMTFKPKRKGDLVFEGEMWINDTTYAVKRWTAGVSETANINYINGFYLDQKFDQVENEVWMLTSDKLIVDLKIQRNSKTLGFVGRKLTTRKDFVINKPKDLNFYLSKTPVTKLDSSGIRDESYWEKNRHSPLNNTENNIQLMIDSLNHVPLFNFFKNLTFMAGSGYYPAGYVEIGTVGGLIGFNRIEGWRNQLQIRTSNKFSKRLELSAKIAYGYRDTRVKYGAGLRFNLTPKKRGMLSLFYDNDMYQLGLGGRGGDVERGFGSLIKTKPIKELTKIEKFGASFEKDIWKSFIIKVGGEWMSYTPFGEMSYRVPSNSVGYTFTQNIRSFETSVKFRYAQDERFISGTFDRISMGSKYPILSLEGTFGIPGILGSDYNYQRVEFKLEHNPKIGVLGKLIYRVYGGMYFGQAAFPFLKIHEGSQTYWFQNFLHNRMDYYEFISDTYVGAQAEHHFNGLIFDRIPGIRKLRWRLVVSGKAVWGTISDRQKEIMLLPSNTKSFGNIPYAESAIGIENIFNVLRVDVVWRMTHLEVGMPPVSIRAKLSIRF